MEEEWIYKEKGGIAGMVGGTEGGRKERKILKPKQKEEIARRRKWLLV